MPDHLILPPPARLASRRSSGGGGGAPPRDRRAHGGQLGRELLTLTSVPRRIDQGVDPDMVFKMRAVSRPTDTGFVGRGLAVLGETVDYTYFVLAGDEGRQLAGDLERYARTGQQSSFFDSIDSIESYGSQDRQGPGLDLLDPASPAVVDVSIWPSSTYDEAVRRAQIVETIVQSAEGSILLRSTGARRNFLRIRISLEGLNDVLDASPVELVRTPPIPFIDFREWRNMSVSDLNLTVAAGGEVGVLDDTPASGHPLLDGLVLSSEDTAPAGYLWRAPGSHGTEVVGRVLYPALETEIRDLEPLTAVGAVRVVRILEPDPGRPGEPPRFATFDFPHEIVAQAIRHLNAEYGIRVFNLSVGYSEPFNELHVGPLTETIDDLVRELGIVVVVPTGNAGIDTHGRTDSGHHIIDDKPNFSFTPSHRLSEPGPAALAITVGSVALSGAAAEISSRVGWQAASEAGEISAFSRTGPGVGTARHRVNKPDVTQYGGNVVINDVGLAVFNDPGAGVLAPSYRATDGSLFASVNGTSYAVPAVARVAADIVHAYPDASANLVRALLASGSSRQILATPSVDDHLRSAAYGLGLPSLSSSILSDSQRVTMTYDGSMLIDTVQIHPLPVPEVFRRGSGGERKITVSLAFDPPVRRQRREYLAASMKVDIYRNIDLADLSQMLEHQDPDDAQDLIDDARRLKLLPGGNSFTNSTLQVREWVRRNSFVNDDETFFVVVTHRAQTWARNNPDYEAQSYALAVTLEDRSLVQASLYDLLTQQVRIATRARVRA